MAKLSKPIESKTEIVVTEGVGHAEFLLRCHSNFQLVLGTSVCNYFPVVLTIHKWSVWNHCPKQVVCLIEKCMSIVARESYFFRRVVWVPTELMYIWAKVEHFQAKACGLLLVHLLELLIFVTPAHVLIDSLALVVITCLEHPKGTSFVSWPVVQVTIIIHTGTIRRYGTREVILQVVGRLPALYLLLNLFSEHAFESTQNLLLIFLPEHVSELCNFPAFFWATDELLTHYRESYLVCVSLEVYIARNHLVNWFVQVEQELLLWVVRQADPAELIRAHGLLAGDLVLHQILHVERLWARDAIYSISVQHFENESGWWSVATVEILAHFTLFLVLLQVFVIHLHVQTVGAVELAALRVGAFHRRIYDFYLTKENKQR